MKNFIQCVIQYAKNRSACLMKEHKVTYIFIAVITLKFEP